MIKCKFFRNAAAALAIAAIAFAGCGEEPEGISDITLIKTRLAADETAGSIAFTAAAPWSIIVPEAARAWLAVSPERGEAGTHTVNITLEKNLTGAERKAEIAIACNGDESTVGITQSAATSGGELPVKKITFRVQRCNEEWTPFGNKEPYIAQSRVVITVFNADGEAVVVQSGADGTAEIMLPEGDYTYKAISEDGMTNTFPANQSPPFIIGGMVIDQAGADYAQASFGSLYPADTNGDGVLNGGDRANAAPLTVSADASVNVYVAPAIFNQACIAYDRAFNYLLNEYDYRMMLREAYTTDASLTHEYNATPVYNYLFAENALLSLWDYSYSLIYGCNTVLRYMDELPDPGLASGQPPTLTEEERETFASAVRYYRAYAYYTLLNYFGGVPITDALHAPITAPRNTAKEVEDFIIAECDFVAANAPTFEPNMAFAARQVKARVLMRNDNFQGAAEALSGIINSGNFSLPAEWGMDAIISDATAPLPSGMMKGNGIYPVRYTETLLLHVEAQFGSGTLNQQDLDRLNQLIMMQGSRQPITPGTPTEEIRAAIRNLWATELNMEGHTYARMKREGTFLAEMEQYGAAEKHLLLPIPQSVMQTNPALIQNPGW